MAGAQRLAHGDDVGHHAVPLEAPERVAGAAEAGLHFVGNEEAAGLAHRVHRLGHEAGRVGEDAVAREHGIDHQRGRAHAVRLEVRDGLAHAIRERAAQFAGRSAVAVRRGHGAHRIAKLHELAERGRGLGDRRGDAVVRKARDDQSLGPGVRACDAHRQVVGLAAGAGEHRMCELGRQGGEQPLGVVEHTFVQVARVGVEHAGLAGNGLDHVRVAMADRGDVVVGVEMGPALGVVQPHAFATHRVQRRVVEQAVGRAEHARAALDQGLGRRGEGSHGRSLRGSARGGRRPLPRRCRRARKPAAAPTTAGCCAAGRARSRDSARRASR